MKRFVKITGCLAAGMMVAVTVRASDTVSSGNPYAQVVARNVFGLNPPPPPVPPQPADPPPKITPNGIMSIFGSLQALYKVTVNTPGQPPKEKSYMLTEGQREDDIEVVKIDEKNAMITFNNHGTVQELALANGQASSGDAGASGPMAVGMPPRPNFGGFAGNRFGGNPAFNNAMAFRNRAPGNNGPMNNGAVPPVGGIGAFGNNYNAANNNANSGQPSQLSAEQQAAMILLQKETLKQQGNPMYKIMPPIPGEAPQGDDTQQ